MEMNEEQKYTAGLHFNEKMLHFHELAFELICHLTLFRHPEIDEQFPLESVAKIGWALRKKLMKIYNDETGFKTKKGIRKQVKKEIMTAEEFELYCTEKKSLQDFDIRDLESFRPVLKNLMTMARINKYLESHPDDFYQLTIMVDTALIGIRAEAQYNQLIGFWTAKMDEKRRNIKSVAVTKEKKNKHKEKLKDLLVKQGWKVDRKFISDTMQLIDRGERTIKNYIDEIKREEQMA